MPERSVDVVVVEDSLAEAELILRALGTKGFGRRVRVVRDGEEALEVLTDAERTGNPRCVVLDLKLPKMGGAEVIRRIRSDPRINTIPIVVLTSSREPRDVAECYAAGANGYVVKPVAFEEFVETVGSLARFWLEANLPPS